MASRKGAVPKYTLEEYEKYINQPQWKLDSADNKSEQDYSAKWAKTIHAWNREYQSQYKTTLAQWDEAVGYIELVPAKTFDIFVPDVAVAQERLSIALNAVIEQIALPIFQLSTTCIYFA